MVYKLGKVVTAAALQVFAAEQPLTFEFQGTNFLLTVSSIVVLDAQGEQLSATRGQLVSDWAWSQGLKVSRFGGHQQLWCWTLKGSSYQPPEASWLSDCIVQRHGVSADNHMCTLIMHG